MNSQSHEALAFYRLRGLCDDGSELVEALPTTAGPWGPGAQHGGPPAGLLGRAIERLDPGVIGRFTMELLGPVPVGPLSVSASVVRPGRTVSLARSELHDVERGRVVATGSAWLFPRRTDGPGSAGPPPSARPHAGVSRERPPTWGAGYLDAVEWRWLAGGLDSPGQGVVWMRPPTLVEGEETSPVARLLTCVDSASGISALLDISQWAFLNTELTVHVLREPVGEWVCVDAVTELGPGTVGLATSRVYDELGPVARSAQALLVQKR